jgi:uncharacterized protein
MQDVIRACLPADEALRRVSNSQQSTFGIKGLGQQIVKSIESGQIPEIDSVNRGIVILKYVAQLHSKSLVVIVDEFDRIEDRQERAKFADFLKQISDQELGTKFIFCGISTDIDSLIGEHFSAGRYISPIELGPLSADSLWEIFGRAEVVFGIEINREIKIRAALIADGYPYFMHLLGDSLLWNMFEAQTDIANPALFDDAIKQSVDEAEPMLRQHYDNATQKYESKDYHEVLWAVSAPRVFPKKWREIYDDYYRPMIRPLEIEGKLSDDSFYSRILNLTKPSHGEILRTNENGWYQFRENVVRSYVRMRAAEAGVDLGPDLPGRLSTD